MRGRRERLPTADLRLPSPSGLLDSVERCGSSDPPEPNRERPKHQDVSTRTGFELGPQRDPPHDPGGVGPRRRVVLGQSVGNDDPVSGPDWCWQRPSLWCWLETPRGSGTLTLPFRTASSHSTRGQTRNPTGLRSIAFCFLTGSLDFASSGIKAEAPSPISSYRRPKRVSAPDPCDR